MSSLASLRLLIGLLVVLVQLNSRASAQVPYSASSAPTINVPINEPPTLRFGMEVRVGALGVEVVDLQNDRPVGKTLKKSDVLRSYELVRSPGSAHRISSEADIDRIKGDLAHGETILLTILRPVAESGSDRSSNLIYTQLVVTLSAVDLLPTTIVREKTVTYSASESVSNTNAGATLHDGVALVSAYYATNRLLNDGKYTGDRDLSDAPLKYGVCQVSIPPLHKRGGMERPSWWRLELSENPLKHVMLRNVAQIGKDNTFQAIASTIESLQPSRKRALIYVHGYNVPFDAAARNAAQLHYDLDFQGVTMFFSWPSNGALRDYVSDSEDIRWSEPHIVDFIRETQQHFDDIYIIAHSMGSRGICQAIVELNRQSEKNKIRELILAAADLDAQVFERDISPIISQSVANSTIYSSSGDLALWSSYALSSNPRVGEVRNGEPTCKAIKRIDVVDASTASTDFLGHSYIGAANIVEDIKVLFEKEKLPPRPNLKLVRGSKGEYWEFELNEIP